MRLPMDYKAIMSHRRFIFSFYILISYSSLHPKLHTVKGLFNVKKLLNQIVQDKVKEFRLLLYDIKA